MRTLASWAGRLSLLLVAVLPAGCSDPDAAFPVEAAAQRLTVTETQRLVEGSGSGVGLGQPTLFIGDTLLAGAWNWSGSVGRVFTYRRGVAGFEGAGSLSTTNAVFGNFGKSLGADGDTIIVGAPADRSIANLGGSAFIFVNSMGTWTEEAKLESDDLAFNHRFGTAVDVSGDTAIVGALSRPCVVSGENACGAVYVFTRTGTTWSQQQRLVPGDPALGDWFGSSVAIDGDLALIGATGDDNAAGSDAGALYVFRRSGSTWSETQKLLPTSAAAAAKLGTVISLDGTRALVGAPGHTGRAGAAYLYEETAGTWAQIQELTAFDAEPIDEFGYSVEIRGTTALVGARYGDDMAVNAGAAYMYELSEGSLIDKHKLLSGSGAAGDELGLSVSWDGVNTAAVSARLLPYGAGAVYVFLPGSGLNDPNGTACTDVSSCASGFCVDGVCCDTDCGGGATSDCQACTMLEGGELDGQCTGLSASRAATTACRPAGGPCDVAEFCLAEVTSCPDDGFFPPESLCRAAVSVCDTPEMCDGTSSICPAEVGSNCDAGIVDAGTVDGGPADLDAAVGELDSGIQVDDGGFDSGSGTILPPPPPPKDGGCGCRTAGTEQGAPLPVSVMLFALLLWRSRRAS